MLPQRWWESASAMRTVSLKDDTEFPQLLLESAKAEAQRGEPPDTGHPKYNKLWWTIGPQVSSHVYGALAPGMPNVAAALARNLGVE